MPACAVTYALTRAAASAPAHEHCEHRIAPWHAPEVPQRPHSALAALWEGAGAAHGCAACATPTWMRGALAVRQPLAETPRGSAVCHNDARRDT
jgi:hypothetical protein